MGHTRINRPNFAKTAWSTPSLDGHFPDQLNPAAERDLAGRLGVTRPTLRETLQRLARDGWLEIRHGKATRVRNYWREGNLGVLAAIAQNPGSLPADFPSNMLAIRSLLAPAYTRLAVERAARQVMELLQPLQNLQDDARTFTEWDWRLQIRADLVERQSGLHAHLQQLRRIVSGAGGGLFRAPATTARFRSSSTAICWATPKRTTRPAPGSWCSARCRPARIVETIFRRVNLSDHWEEHPCSQRTNASSIWDQLRRAVGCAHHRRGHCRRRAAARSCPGGPARPAGGSARFCLRHVQPFLQDGAWRLALSEQRPGQTDHAVGARAPAPAARRAAA